jgi:hypothetical protein
MLLVVDLINWTQVQFYPEERELKKMVLVTEWSVRESSIRIWTDHCAKLSKRFC